MENTSVEEKLSANLLNAFTLESIALKFDLKITGDSYLIFNKTKITPVVYWQKIVNNKVGSLLYKLDGKCYTINHNLGNSESVPKWLRYLCTQSNHRSMACVPFFHGFLGTIYFYKSNPKIDMLFV